MIKLIFGFTAGAILTCWVHPFATITSFTESQQVEFQIRSDNYKKCESVNVYMNAQGKAETEYQCSNGDLFYVVKDVRVYYKENVNGIK